MSNSIVQTVKNVQRKDIVWTDRNLSKTPFHTGFWVNKRIGDAIAAHAHLARGVLLDVGCGVKPYEKIFAPFVEKYYGTEYSATSGFRGNRADVAGDAERMPFADASVDTILCTEVLEHVKNPEMVIEEFARILKSGGVIITTAPFFYPIHDSYDFFRYTDTGLAAIMKRYNLEIEKVEPLSGTGLTVAMMFNFYLFDLGFMWTKWMYPIGLVLRPLLWILICLVNALGWIMEKAIPSKQMAFNHLTVGRKK
ncbi:MAG: class I SAM-dependent methyltransferase [Pyrinomonadaceae bacterium]